MFHLSPSLEFHQGTLTLGGIKRPAMEKLFAGIPWQWDGRASIWRIDARFYSQVEPSRTNEARRRAMAGG
jgi:hypothetical protein